jgi:imidazolonepropionase
MEIARRGGGIHSSVRDLRQRSEDDLFALAKPRLERLASFGPPPSR